MLATLIVAVAALAQTAGTTASSIAGLASAAGAGTNVQYDITGTASGVIRISGSRCHMFLSDATGSTFFRIHDADGPYRISPGDLVRVRGTCPKKSGAGGFDHHFASSVERIKPGEAPQPVQATVRDIGKGGLDYRLVRTSGLVRNVAMSETGMGWVKISLLDDGELLRVSVPILKTPIEKYTKLIGRRIEVEGFPNPQGGSPRRFAGRTFHSAGLSAIRVLDDPEADPFAVPGLETLVSHTAAQIASFGPVKALGRVICTWDGNLALVKTTDHDFVRVAFDSGARPERGDSIECAGFPLTDAFHITLVHAKWRKTNDLGIEEDPPRKVTVRNLKDDRLVHTEFHGRVIVLKGKVRVVVDDSGAIDSVIMEDGGTAMTLHAEKGWPRGLETGCTVEATGVCIMEAKRWQPELVVPKIRDIDVVIRGPDDVRIVGRPPWWTPARLSIVVCSLLAALLAAIIWNRALKRLAERSGRRLMAEEIGRVKAELKTEERTRLSVELHDSLAQNLTGVSMELLAAQRYGEKDVAAMMRHVETAGASLRSCLRGLCNTLWDLRSQALESRDLATAIRRTLLPHIKGVELSAEVDVPLRRLTEQETHDVLCIVRELALNGIIHGKATSIKIAGELSGNVLRLTVSDNGSGFDLSSAPGTADGHFGIQGIRDRLANHSGSISYATADSGGTVAEVNLAIHLGGTT